MRFSFFQFIVSTLLFSLSALPVAAFYNPNTGRWLNRDPIGERGGANENSFAFNSPISRFDKLGQDCGPMTVTDLGHRDSITNVNDHGGVDVNSGNTTITSWVMSTVVDRCFPGFSTCQHKVRIRACWASVEYYYDNSESDKAHEEQHKNDATRLWDSLRSAAQNIAGNCHSQRKALCYQDAIDQYCEAFELEWWALGYELDCSTYSSDPNSRYCVNARDYRSRSDAALIRANNTVSRCALMP